VLKKNPELVEEYIDRAASLLHDKNQGVALSGVTLMLAITGLEPGAVERYRAHVPVLCKMLRGLLQVGPLVTDCVQGGGDGGGRRTGGEQQSLCLC
jgi:AP-1 complex subunit gamma-1